MIFNAHGYLDYEPNSITTEIQFCDINYLKEKLIEYPKLSILQHICYCKRMDLLEYFVRTYYNTLIDRETQYPTKVEYWTILLDFATDIPMLEYLKSCGCSATTNAIDKNASLGNLELVKWLTENKYKGTRNAIYNALMNNHLETAKYIYENISKKCPEKIFSDICRCGIGTESELLETLKWLESKYPKEFLKYITFTLYSSPYSSSSFPSKRVNGKDSFPPVSDVLGNGPYLEILKWLHSKGMVMYKEYYDIALWYYTSFVKEINFCYDNPKYKNFNARDYLAIVAYYRDNDGLSSIKENKVKPLTDNTCWKLMDGSFA